MVNLTKAESAILQCLGGMLDYRASNETVRRFALLTHRGYYTVRRRMMDKNLIAWAANASEIQITFGGIRAIRKSD